jgi:hypothetical protein
MLTFEDECELPGPLHNSSQGHFAFFPSLDSYIYMDENMAVLGHYRSFENSLNIVVTVGIPEIIFPYLMSC